MADEIDPQITDTNSESGGESQTSGNPAWADIRDQLDPISFSKIEPKLKEWETGVDQRFNQTAEKYKWADDVSKQGYQPEQVTQALQVAKMLNEQPEYIYQQLQTFLEQNGRLPSKQELADQVEEDSQQEEDDPRIAALAQQQEQMQQFLIMQENQRMQQQADAALETEISQLKQKHPEFDDNDMREIISRAAFQAQMAEASGNRKIPTLEEAATDYVNNVRNRILSAQRPGDSAPRLVPTNGGVPASGVAKGTMGSLSKQQTEDLLTEMLKLDKSRG